MSSLPSGFDRQKQTAYQRDIDALVGTSDGRPRIKLDWGPEALTWCPYRLGTDPPGYTFPIFYQGKDKEGHYLSAERWVLRERIEWEQYGPSWEAIRYKKHDGAIWDLKGPCPEEKYVELRCHVYHNGLCCPCIGDECKCGTAREHCWGTYVEPDEHLMGWIRRVSWEARQDPDVDPHADVRFFEATHAQQSLKSAQNTQIEKSKEDTDFDREARDLFLKNPHSVQVKFKKTDSGLYLPN